MSFVPPLLRGKLTANDTQEGKLVGHRETCGVSTGCTATLKFATITINRSRLAQSGLAWLM
jgi:hypothetical protein